MNHIQVKLKSGLILCLPFVCSCNREPARPNILFIMSDDHAGSCISIPTFGDRIVTKIRLYAHASNANMSTNTISLNDGEPVAFASFNESSNVNKNGGILEIDVPETLQGQALALNWGSNTNAAICAIAFEFAE